MATSATPHTSSRTSRGRSCRTDHGGEQIRRKHDRDHRQCQCRPHRITQILFKRFHHTPLNSNDGTSLNIAKNDIINPIRTVYIQRFCAVSNHAIHATSACPNVESVCTRQQIQCDRLHRPHRYLRHRVQQVRKSFRHRITFTVRENRPYN